MMTPQQVRALAEHYNHGYQGNDPIACQTRVALCEYAKMIEEHAGCRDLLSVAMELMTEGK